MIQQLRQYKQLCCAGPVYMFDQIHQTLTSLARTLLNGTHTCARTGTRVLAVRHVFALHAKPPNPDATPPRALLVVEQRAV